MREYAVIHEAGPNNWSAYVPALPGCISTGKTQHDIERNIQEAIELHIEGMLADGESVPEPSSIARNVRVLIAACSTIRGLLASDVLTSSNMRARNIRVNDRLLLTLAGCSKPLLFHANMLPTVE